MSVPGYDTLLITEPIGLSDDAGEPEGEPDAGLHPAVRHHLQQPPAQGRLHDPLPEQEGHPGEEDQQQPAHPVLSRLHGRGQKRLNLLGSVCRRCV